MRIIALATFLLAKVASSSNNSLSEQGLNRANNQSQYIARYTMQQMFEDTKKYITGLNEYIQVVEIDRFKKTAVDGYTKFIEKYNVFYNEWKEMDKAYAKYLKDESNEENTKKFHELTKKVDKAFTDATKQYTYSFRKINASLTKLDKSKIMYTDAEIFKTYSKITVRSLNHLTAMEQMVELINKRSDECGTLSNRDQFYRDALEKMKTSSEETEKICDAFPLSILSSEEYDRVKKDYEKVKNHFNDSILALEKFEQELEKKYKEGNIKYDKRFKYIIQMIKRLPFRISAFVTPNCLGTLLITTVFLF